MNPSQQSGTPQQGTEQLMNQQSLPPRDPPPYPPHSHPQQYYSPSFPPPPRPLRSFPWTPVAIALGIGLVLALSLGVALYSGTAQRILLAVQPSCTVGVTGTAATFTIEGWSANQDCQNIVSGKSSFLGTFPPTRVYLYTGSPTNPEVCEVDVQGRHVIVRDEGVLKLVGNALCQALQQPPKAQHTHTLTSALRNRVAMPLTGRKGSPRVEEGGS
jgi:hypothetical protein